MICLWCRDAWGISRARTFTLFRAVVTGVSRRIAKLSLFLYLSLFRGSSPRFSSFQGSQALVGNFTSQDCYIMLRSCRSDSSSLQISTIHVGRFTGGKRQPPTISAILRKTSTNIARKRTTHNNNNNSNNNNNNHNHNKTTSHNRHNNDTDTDNNLTWLARFPGRAGRSAPAACWRRLQRHTASPRAKDNIWGNISGS